MSDESYKHANRRGMDKKKEKKEEGGFLSKLKAAVTSKKFGSKLIKAGNKGKKKKEY